MFHLLPERYRAKAIFAACLLLYFLISIYVICIFLIGSDFGGQFAHSFKSMIEGNSETPMQYRVLSGLIVRFIIFALPAEAIEYLNQLGLLVRDGKFMQTLIFSYRGDVPPFQRDVALLHQTVVYVAFTWLCLLGYALMLYKLARKLMPQSTAYALVAPIIGMMTIPILHRNFAYPYDYVMLLLMSLCMMAMITNRIRLYYFCFVLAIMNKETAIFIFFLNIIWFAGRTSWKLLAINVFCQLAIYIGISWFIRYSPETIISTNGIFSSTYTQMKIALRSYELPDFISILMLFFLLTAYWSKKPEFLRLGLWLFVPLAFAFIWLGFPGEYRQLMDITPIAALLATHTLVYSMSRS